jgi:hypothetical protein
MQPTSTNEFDWERWASQRTDVITNVLHKLAWHLTTERMPIVKEGHHGWIFSQDTFTSWPIEIIEYIPLEAPESDH